MSFAARGEMLRAMSRALHAHRDELIGLAILNGGNTRSDAKFDIDGASGTLAAYADLAAELGDARVLVDGDATQLGRSARLFGQHVWVSRHGVAVHVNAFNFPAWGLAEKAACALLAGMPVIAKPATSTALVAHRIARIFDAEKLLPDGALSFLCGSAGDLLSHLGGQDVLAFTGSSSTGVLLRGGKSVLAHSVRVNVEADSLNAAVLGPDVEEGSELWTLFVTDVVRDMTQKTGQKCTAIRRVYVPAAKIDAVVESVRERLAAIKVGDPAREDTTMGPLATAQQLADVRAGIAKLETCAKIVFGSAKDETVGKGVLPVAGPARRRVTEGGDAVHEHEVFGPVSTMMPYDGSAEGAARLVGAGGWARHQRLRRRQGVRPRQRARDRAVPRSRDHRLLEDRRAVDPAGHRPPHARPRRPRTRRRRRGARRKARPRLLHAARGAPGRPRAPRSGEREALKKERRRSERHAARAQSLRVTASRFVTGVLFFSTKR